MIRPHLTDDQFAEILIKGSVTHEIEDHLAKCASCRDELGVFSETVGDFRNVSLRWMEARPATSLRQAAHESARRVTYLKYGWAAAAAVLLAVPVWTYSHRSVSMNQHQTAAMQRDEQEPIADSETQIAKDNELLQAVNLALADSEPPELREYGIVSDRRTRVALRPESRNE